MISEQILKKIDYASGLVFDMDGTLADNMGLHFLAWSKVAKHYSLSLPEKRFYELGGVPTYQILEILCEEQNIKIDLDEATKMKESLYKEFMADTTAMASVVAIAEKYKNVKPIGVATGSTQQGADWILSKLKIKEWFGAIVTSDDVENHKPAPDVFLEACRQLNIDPTKAVGFEDTDLGLQSIERAGMFAVDVRLFPR